MINFPSSGSRFNHFCYPDMAVLPDLLQKNLKIVFCGTAPSRKSAQMGAYYAHGGNLFWDILFRAGFTPTRLAPAQFRDLLDLGIGLTDLNKVQSGVDRELDAGAFDPQGLLVKVTAYRPAILAFTSKNSAKAFYRCSQVDYGRQVERIEGTIVWVLPSTSGSARPHWGRLKHHWYNLAKSFQLP